MNRNYSAQRKIISAKNKKKSDMVSVDDKELQKQGGNFKDVGVIGPDGKKENWKVEDDKKKAK